MHSALLSAVPRQVLQDSASLKCQNTQALLPGVPLKMLPGAPLRAF